MPLSTNRYESALWISLISILWPYKTYSKSFLTAVLFVLVPNPKTDYILQLRKRCVSVLYSLAVFADEQERDRVNAAGFFACTWWLWPWWRWTWFRWHRLRHSLSELVLCYLASIAFWCLMGGSDEQEWPAPDWLRAGQCDRVPVVDVAIGVWLWPCRRTDNDFFWREISLRKSDSFRSMSFFRWKGKKKFSA